MRYSNKKQSPPSGRRMQISNFSACVEQLEVYPATSVLYKRPEEVATERGVHLLACPWSSRPRPFRASPNAPPIAPTRQWSGWASPPPRPRRSRCYPHKDAGIWQGGSTGMTRMSCSTFAGWSRPPPTVSMHHSPAVACGHCRGGGGTGSPPRWWRRSRGWTHRPSREMPSAPPCLFLLDWLSLLTKRPRPKNGIPLKTACIRRLTACSLASSPL